ncbi:MAG: SIR2 family protein [Opitutaceae bacterium]
MASKSKLLCDLAAKAHEHRLVPFVGAGCSLGHIPVNWDQIAAEMARAMPGCTETDNMKIAEAYASAFGDDGFAAFLRDRLLIATYDDARGATPLQILALELRSVYSTNQDNVLERAAEKYGRPRVVVSTLEELATVRPGDRILYKFHGSLDHPETLVFTASQYQKRIATPDHFMDIRLRSDLLAKRFLFIGYSFRDPNIQELFKEMAKRFPAALPGSLLLAYQWTPELDDLCNVNNVD